MGRAVARRHRGKGTGAGVGRGRARGRLEPGRAPGAARTARLSRSPGDTVPRDVGRGGGHSAAARLDRRHLTQHTTDPRGARDLIRVRRARRGRVGDPGARQQILPALRHCQRDAQPHQLSRQLRDRLPGRSGAALPESSGGANRFPGRSQVVLGNGLVHGVRRHSRDPGAGAVREWNGRLHRDRVWPWPRLRPRARLQGDDVDSPPGAQLRGGTSLDQLVRAIGGRVPPAAPRSVRRQRASLSLSPHRARGQTHGAVPLTRRRCQGGVSQRAHVRPNGSRLGRAQHVLRHDQVLHGLHRHRVLHPRPRAVDSTG